MAQPEALATDRPTKLLEIQDRSEYRRRMNELLPLRPASTVVVSVDMQRDYLDLQVGTCPLTPDEAERVLDGCARLLDASRAAGVQVIHAYVAKTQAEFDAGVFGNPLSRASARAGLSQNVWKGVRRSADRLIGSPQAEVPSALVQDGDLHVSSKRTNDAAHGTNLLPLLQQNLKAENVLLIGVNTDTCVYSTAFSLSNNGLNTVIVEDGVGSTRGTDHHLMALELMSRTFAWVMDVPTIVEKLRTATV